MKLYHFTSAEALLGDDAPEKLEAHAGETVDLFEFAAAGSILAAGLKPAADPDAYDRCFLKPLPPCVWLTADPKMSADYCNTNGKWRVELEIEKCDSRLRRWDEYVNENCPIPHVFERIAPSIEALEANVGFFLYFGAIHPRRITNVEVQ